MWRSWDGLLFFFLSFSGCGRAILPHPRTKPRDTSGHRPKEVGHVHLANCHILYAVGFSQSNRMCSRDSEIVLQLAQHALCS